MFNVAVTALLLAIVFSLSFGQSEIKRMRAINTESAVIAMNLNVYGTSVARYVYNNPGASGEISASDLNLPEYFNAWNGLSNLVSGERSYVFVTGLERDKRAYVLRNLHDMNQFSGYARNNRLISSNGTDLGALPSGIPNDTVVTVL